MFDKIQVILTMKATVSKNRISRLNDNKNDNDKSLLQLFHIVKWRKLAKYESNIQPRFLTTYNETFRAGNYMFKVNNRNTRTRCEICSMLTIKTPERTFWCLYC